MNSENIDRKKIIGEYLSKQLEGHFHGNLTHMAEAMGMNSVFLGRLKNQKQSPGIEVITQISAFFHDDYLIRACFPDLVSQITNQSTQITPAKITIVGIVNSQGEVAKPDDPEVHYRNIPLTTPENCTGLLIQGFLDFGSGFTFLPNDLVFLGTETASTGNLVLVSKGRSRFVRRFWTDSFTDPSGKPDHKPYKILSKLISIHRRLN